MDTSLIDAKKAAENLLKSTNVGVQIAYENVKFTPPSTALYLETQFQYGSTVDPVFTAGYHREAVIFNVYVVGVLNTGTAEVLTKVLAIRDTFHKGLTMQQGNTSIHILRTPHIAGTMVAGDRIVAPISIELVTEVYNF